MEDVGSAEVQIALISEVVALLGEAEIPCWLWGGWAVDFLDGAVGRPHRDVEFVVWEHDRERLRELLRRHDYAIEADEVEDLITRKHGQLVEFYVIRVNTEGQIVTPGRWEFWPWPADAFGGTIGRLGDVQCQVVSPRAQVACKEEYQAQTGDPPRPKDLDDLRRLRKLIGEQEGAAEGQARRG